MALAIACCFCLSCCASEQPKPETTTTAQTTMEEITAETTEAIKTTRAFVEHTGPYADILNAYAELERSGYKTCDKQLIGDSKLAYGVYPNSKAALYTFYDINHDGKMELLIGARVMTGNGESYDTLLGIYALQNDTYVSVIQEEYSRHLFLLMDKNDNPVIEDSYGHQNFSDSSFYTLDKNGGLKVLVKLYTDGCDMTNYNEETGEGVIYNRSKEMNGKLADISEEEYLALLRKYGSCGYSTSIPESEARQIALEWRPVS